MTKSKQAYKLCHNIEAMIRNRTTRMRKM